MPRRRSLPWAWLAKRFRNRGLVRTRLQGLTIADHLHQLEKALGYRLPNSYRVFLLGLETKPLVLETTFDVLKVNDPERILYSFAIRKFLRPRPGAKDDLLRTWYRYRDRLPSGVLPIAYDRFRNLMCLALPTGEVVFWDAQGYVEDKTAPRWRDTNNLYPVAAGFEGFMDRLYRGHRFL